MNCSTGTSQEIKKNRIDEFTASHKTNHDPSSVHNVTEARPCNKFEERKQIERSSYAEKVLSFNATANTSTKTQDIAQDNDEIQELFQNTSFPKEISEKGKNIKNEATLKSIEDLSRKLNQKLNRKYNLPPNFVPIEFLGAGGFGNVYKVFDKVNRCFLAAKEPKPTAPDLFDDETAYQEYLALLKLSRINNPKLLGVVQVYEPEKKFYAIMEYGHGNLRDFCYFRKKKQIPWTDEDLVELYYQLVDQIDELRKIKICHRDIKPENIIYSASARTKGIFKLTDFGFAEEVADSVDIEQELSVVGTKGYCHPKIEEAAKNDKETCRVVPYEADLFSIEVTINEILKDNGRSETINDLLKDIERPYKEILNEEELNKYKIFLFEEFYKKTISFEEKFEKLQIFPEYCAFDDISKWLINKLENLKDDNEARLIYFFLGKVLDLHGQHKEAIDSLKECEKRSRNIDDKLTASLYTVMGIIQFHLFDFNSARECHLKGLEIKTKLFGELSPEVAEENVFLAYAEFTLGNRERASNLSEKTIAIYEQKQELISNSTISWLAFLVTGLGNYEEAIAINQKLYDGTKESRGERHPTVALILMCLGVAYHRLGKTEDAIVLLRKSLTTHKETVREDHQHMTYFWFHCGEAFKESGDFEMAMDYFEKSLKLLKEKYPKKPLKFAAMIFIAELWLQRNEKLKKAQRYLEKCKKNLLEIKHSDHYYVGVFWRALGLFYQKKRRYGLALQKYFKSIKSFKKLSSENIWVASTLIQIGLVYFEMKNYQASEINLLQAHSILHRHDSHNIFINCSFQLGQLYFAQRNYSEARKYFTEAKEMRADLRNLGYPESYPTTKEIENGLNETNSDFPEGDLNNNEIIDQTTSG